MFKSKWHRRKYGFTLIELLVAMSIISMLSSTVTVAVSETRSKVRDTVRIAHTYSIITALQLYYSTHNKYPCHAFYDGSSNANFLQPLVDEGFLSTNPRDPVNLADPWLQYEYMTFHQTGSSDCGKAVYLAVTTENRMGECPGNGIPVNPYHCHIYLTESNEPMTCDFFWILCANWEYDGVSEW